MIEITDNWLTLYKLMIAVLCSMVVISLYSKTSYSTVTVSDSLGHMSVAGDVYRTNLSLECHSNTVHQMNWAPYEQLYKTCGLNSTTFDESSGHTKGAVIHILLSHCIKDPNDHVRLSDAANLLKSAVFMASDKFLHIHVITDFKVSIIKQVVTWPKSVKSRFKLTFYNTCFPSHGMKEAFRTCSTQRLFAPLIVKHVDKVIYVDTDSLILSHVADVWDIFNEFNSSQALAMADESHGSHGWYHEDGKNVSHLGNGLNAGILLMYLSRLRNREFYCTIADIVGHQATLPEHFSLADQDFLNEYLYKNPDKLFKIPCHVNFRSDFVGNKTTSCDDVNRDGISILHGNRYVFHHPGAYQAVFQVMTYIPVNASPKEYLTLLKATLEEKNYGNFPVDILYKRLHKKVFHGRNV